MVPVDTALRITLSLSTFTSMRRWPSMRRDRIDDDALAAVVEREALRLDSRHDYFSASLTLSLRVLLRACLIALTAACAATAAPAAAARRAGRSCRRWPRCRTARRLIVVRWS